MIRPISCPNCKRALAWYDSDTGCLHEDGKPTDVFGKYLRCTQTPGCHTVYRYDGSRVVKKNKKERRKAQAQTSVSDQIAAGLQNLKLAFEG